MLNGYQDSERRSVDRMIDDWFALLNHGHIVTATGNSDTHHLDHNIGGYPRNYVRVQEDQPQSLREPLEIPRAVKGHHAFFTTGPFVDLAVDGAGIGDVAPARGGDAKVALEVRAAPWVSVSTVTLYLDGHEAHRWKVDKSDAGAASTRSFHVHVARDGWVVVRVDGDEPLAPVVGDRKRFDVRPLALTNPVFLDVDGNGKYDPPEKHGPHDGARPPRAAADTEWNCGRRLLNARSIRESRPPRTRDTADPVARSLGPSLAPTLGHATSGAQKLYAGRRARRGAAGRRARRAVRYAAPAARRRCASSSRRCRSCTSRSRTPR